MKLQAAAIIALVVGSLTAMRHAPSRGLDYTFTLAHDSSGAPIVNIAATFPPSADTLTHLVHPTSWAGETSLEHGLSNVDVQAPAKIVGDSDGAYLVVHPRGTALSVHYTLKQDWTGPLRYPQYHRAIVSDTYVVFNAQNGLLFPDRHSDRTVPINVTWRGVPTEWVVTTSFGGGLVQHGMVNAPQLVDASFAAGRFRRTVNGGLSIAIGGTWRFADTAFAGILERVYKAERAFWRDQKARPYFVVLLPMDRRGGIGGTAFTGGFVSIADTTSVATGVGLNVAHELFHEWNGHELRTPNPEGPDKWFSEGFTDYYADRMSREAGLLSDSGYVDRVNSAIRRYYMSPMHGSDRATIATEYWQKTEAKDYPYTQGYTFALFLNRELPALTNGKTTLDDVMRTVHATAVAKNRVYSDSLLIASAPSATRARLRTLIDSMITRGADIPVLPNSLPWCDSMVMGYIPLFDLGFDGSSLANGRVVHGVEADGPAARAGLKEGAALRGWSWNNGNSTSQVRLVLADGTAITYMPAAEKSVAVPRITGCR